MFSKSVIITIDIEEEFKKVIAQNLRSKEVLEKSINQHALMCVENSKDLYHAKMLSKLLSDDIESRVKRFISCLGKTSKNYREWLIEDYKNKLSLAIGKKYRELNI
jgi:ribosome-binding factor A